MYARRFSKIEISIRRSDQHNDDLISEWIFHFLKFSFRLRISSPFHAGCNFYVLDRTSCICQHFHNRISTHHQTVAIASASIPTTTCRIQFPSTDSAPALSSTALQSVVPCFRKIKNYSRHNHNFMKLFLTLSFKPLVNWLVTSQGGFRKVFSV